MRFHQNYGTADSRRSHTHMGFGGMGSITSGPGSSGSGPGGFGSSGSGSGLGGFGFSGSLATSMPSEQQLSGHSSSSTISRARDRAVTRTRNRRRSERHKERSGRCVGLVRDRVRNTAARDSFLADPRPLESRAREDPMRWRAPLRELLLGQNLHAPIIRRPGSARLEKTDSREFYLPPDSRLAGTS